MAKRPTLSVVMPNYNHACYVAHALGSILRQSVPADEIFVVDDASTDDSLEVIERCIEGHPSVQLIRNPQNLGVARSVTKALERCSGDFVYCAAADDMALPGFFESALTLLAEHPEAGICFSDVMLVFPQARQLLTAEMLPGCQAPQFLSPARFLALLAARREAGSPTAVVLLNRRGLLETGGFIPELRYYTDFLPVHTLGFRYGVCYFPDRYFAAVRTNPSSYGSVRARTEDADAFQCLLDVLLSDRFRDVMPYFRDSGIMLCCTPQALVDVCGRATRYRQFMTPAVRRRLRYLRLRHMLAQAARLSPEMKLAGLKAFNAMRQAFGLSHNIIRPIPPSLRAEAEQMFV